MIFKNTVNSKLLGQIKYSYLKSHFVYYYSQEYKMVLTCGRILEISDSVHHVQCHIAYAFGVVSLFLGCSADHHVGITNGLHLGPAAVEIFFARNKPQVQNIQCSKVKYHRRVQDNRQETGDVASSETSSGTFIS